MTDTATRVRQIVADHFGRKVEEITEATRFGDDLGGDSLDPLELAIEIEDSLSVDLIEDDHTKWTTVGNVIEAVEAHFIGRATADARAAAGFLN